ncbi:hypothetical protein BGX38DRAFT_721178 [Terfezia claveryi]|nr:hypothetical protein BGX38DRAFT_721178 [Terfezia claveryi]
MIRLTPFRQFLQPSVKSSLTTVRYTHTPTNTPQNTPSHTRAPGQNITQSQTSNSSPRLSGDSPSKASKTGTINLGESSQYSHEATKSGTHQEIIEDNPQAAFNPSFTRPDEVKRSAEKESGDTGNPLEYSGANPRVSQVKRDDRPVSGDKVRSQASGGTKRA